MVIHGIRTQAPWVEMVANVIETETGAQVQPIKYGYFDIARFLFPFLTRRAPIRRIVREYRDLKLRHPGARISVIAHSFGTYALTKALEEPDLVFHRIILCGSIVRDDFRVALHRDQIGSDPILNDCGTHDAWPAFAKSISWGYGATGTFGFGAAGIRDRFSKFSHSSYFRREFVRDYWIPFLKEGKIVGTAWEIDPERKAPPYWQSLLAAVPTRWLAVLLAFGGLAWLVSDNFSASAAHADLEQMHIGHWIGVSQVYARMSFENTSLYDVTFHVMGMSLAPPEEGDAQLNFEVITNCNGMVPSDVRIMVPAKRTVLCDYSFLANVWGMQGLYNKLGAHAQAAGLQNVQPDPTKTVIDGDLLAELKKTAGERFAWRSGKWTLTVQYNVAGDTRTASYVFSVDEKMVATLKKQPEYYGTGFGVLPAWRYFTPTGQQPMQQVSVAPAIGP